MPSAAAIVRSRGVVMNPRTRSALAPTYTVVTVTAALSLRGYWRTVRVLTACSPAMRITRLITIARTGRRINRSVKDFMPVTRYPSAIGGFRRLGRFRGNTVLFYNRHSGPQFEQARTHNAVPGFYT